MKKNQQGYLLIIAVLFILVIGVMGSIVTYLFANRAMLSVAQQNGYRAFYIAESGLEIGTRLLTMPNLTGSPIRIACNALTGNSAVTNASLANGTFTLTAINSSPTFAVSTLSSAETASDLVINAASTSGFASSGKIMIDQEAINYAAISGNTFIGVTRGTSGTSAASHASGTRIAQYQCSLDVKSGIPSLSSPPYQRELQRNVQLEEGWAVGNALSGSSWNFVHWNRPTELQWIQQTPSVASTQTLNGVSVVSNADVWAVGNNASAFRYNGVTWATINTGITSADDLRSVSAVSSNEAWACASQGKIYKWSGGTSWSNPSSPGNTLNSISMVDINGNGTADIGWVVGSNRTAYFYNGSSWASANTGITVTLNGVSTISANDAWAAGNSGNIFKWNGTSWADISTPTSANLNSISMINTGSSDIGWAAGASSTALYYDGTSWTLKNTGLAGNLTLNSIVITSLTQAWVVASNGAIYQWNGSNWSLRFTSTRNLNGIDIVHLYRSPTSGWRQIFH